MPNWSLTILVTDSILHTWHRSYDSIPAQLEESHLYDALGKMLNLMAEQVQSGIADYGKQPLADSVGDADYFLAVARSLLSGAQVTTCTGQDALVSQTLRAIAVGTPMFFNLFGRLERDPGNPRNLVDFFGCSRCGATMPILSVCNVIFGL